MYGAFSAALLLSGLLGPVAGRAIERCGGRDVLGGGLGPSPLSSPASPTSAVMVADPIPNTRSTKPAGTDLVGFDREQHRERDINAMPKRVQELITNVLK